MTKIKYNQLTPEQRYKIQSLLQMQKSKSQIAILIGVHKSTISRELSRNVAKRGFGSKIYTAEGAQLKASIRHKVKNKRIVFSDALQQEVKFLMQNKKYSPEVIRMHWDRENVVGVSHETIYKFLWQMKHSNKIGYGHYKDLHKHLKHNKRRRKRGNYKGNRGLISNRTSIELRPKVVNSRNRVGDLEVDLIMGKAHKSALLVTVDRASLHATINKVNGKNAAEIKNKLIQLFSGKNYVKTMTFDNDLAFAKHQLVAKKLKIDTYFTRPYTSQDKGTIENRNGLIRQFYPKKTDFNLYTHQQIRHTQNLINDRPVRKFGNLTPNEVFLLKS
jgi:transposase, IS30 family